MTEEILVSLEDREDLRAVAFEILEKGYYTLSDYFRFCEQNNILVF